jgi:hypothetical protein
MLNVKHNVLVLLSFCFIQSFSSPFTSSPGKKSGNSTRINFGPVIGFYSFATKHATNPVRKMSVVFGFKREQRVDRSYKVFFLFGFDYFLHGLNFKSYYFKPDTIKLYDKSFDYAYSLFIHEMNFPLQVKYLFKSSDNSLFSPYVAISYHLRYLAFANLSVTQSGSVVRKDSPELKFRSPFITDRINSFVSLSLGWQKNGFRSSAGRFFAEVNFRYGFSPFYFETDYSATSLYINSAHLGLLLGLKF